MSIMLGNLQLKDVINDIHLEKIEKYLNENGYQKENKCDCVKNKIGNYHIYDMPKLIVICGEIKMNEFIDFLKKKDLIGNGFKEKLGLTYCDLK